MTETRNRRHRGRWLTLVAALVASPLAAEFGLRWMLFGSDPVANKLGASLRASELYAEPRYEEDGWKLKWIFQPEMMSAFPPEEWRDEKIGWLPESLEPGTYEHRFAEHLGDRQPVLMYGASFATLNYSVNFERSAYRNTHGLLTYGIWGGGLDQSLMLMRETLADYADREPIVLYALALDTDLARSLMSFRDAPRPRYRLDEAGELEYVAPVSHDGFEYLEQSPASITSYLWASANATNGWLPGASKRRAQRYDDAHDEALVVNRKLLLAMKAETEAVGGRFTVLVMHILPQLQLAEIPKAERDLIAVLEQEGIDYVESRGLFAHQLEIDEAPLESYFEPRDDWRWAHPNIAGEIVLFELIRRALREDYDHSTRSDSPYAAVLPLDRDTANQFQSRRHRPSMATLPPPSSTC